MENFYVIGINIFLNLHKHEKKQILLVELTFYTRNISFEVSSSSELQTMIKVQIKGSVPPFQIVPYLDYSLGPCLLYIIGKWMRYHWELDSWIMSLFCGLQKLYLVNFIGYRFRHVKFSVWRFWRSFIYICLTFFSCKSGEFSWLIVLYYLLWFWFFIFICYRSRESCVCCNRFACQVRFISFCWWLVIVFLKYLFKKTICWEEKKQSSQIY